MVTSRTGFNSKTLSKLLKQPNGYVFLRRCERHIALSPIALNDIKAAIRAHLNTSITRFDAELDAVVIGFRNINVLTNVGTILNDSPHIHIDVEVEFYVFKPEKGSILTGLVKKKSRDNIGCLVHDIFNASIPLELEDGVDLDNVSIGEPLTFRVTEVDFSGSLPYIRGKLVDSLEGVASKQFEGDLKRKRNDDDENQFQKKIKIEVHNSSLEEENNLRHSKVNVNSKLPTSILKKSNSLIVEGSPARRISFFGDTSCTSREFKNFRKDCNKDVLNKEKKKKETKNIIENEGPIESKKLKMSASTNEYNILECESFYEDGEPIDLSSPVEVTSKKKKNKLKRLENEIWNPNNVEQDKGEKNYNCLKRSKKNKDLNETIIPNFEETIENYLLRTDSDSSVQKLKTKKKKKKESSVSEQEELESSKCDQLVQNIENVIAVQGKKKKVKKDNFVAVPISETRESLDPYFDQIPLNEFPEQRVKKKKRDKIGPDEKKKRISQPNGVEQLRAIKEPQDIHKEDENAFEYIQLQTEKKYSIGPKFNESSVGEHKSKKRNKKDFQLMDLQCVSEVPGTEMQDANELSEFESRTKKSKNERSHKKQTTKEEDQKHGFTTNPIPVQECVQEQEREIHAYTFKSHLKCDDTDKKNKVRKENVESLEFTQLKEKELFFEFKPKDVANSTIIENARSMKRKAKESNVSVLSYDFPSPIKDSNNARERDEDDLRCITSNQIKTDSEMKITSEKNSSLNSPKPKGLVSSRVPVTWDSLSPIKQVDGCPENYDNLEFITSTQISSIPKAKKVSPAIKIARSSLSDLSHPKETMSRAVINSLDSLSPINKVDSSPEYYDNNGFITSTQMNFVPQTKNTYFNSQRTARSPSKSPKRKSSVSSSGIDSDNNNPSSVNKRKNSFRVPPPRNSISNISDIKSVRTKKIVKGSSPRESSDSVHPAKAESPMQNNIKLTEPMNNKYHQTHSDDSSSSSSSSRSSMKLTDRTSLNNINEDLNEIVHKITKQKRITSSKSKSGSSDLSCSDCNTPASKDVTSKLVSENNTGLSISLRNNKMRSELQFPDKLGKIFSTKSASLDDESEIDSSDSNLPYVHKAHKSLHSSAFSRKNTSFPVVLPSSQNNIPKSVSSSISSEQHKIGKSLTFMEKNSDESLKNLPFLKLQKLKSHVVTKYCDGEKHEENLGSLPLSKTKKSKSKYTAKKENLKGCYSQVTNGSGRGSSDDEIFFATPDLEQSITEQKAVSLSMSSKQKMESCGHNVIEHGAGLVVKDAPHKTKREVSVPSEKHNLRKKLKMFKKSSKVNVTCAPEAKSHSEGKKKIISKLTGSSKSSEKEEIEPSLKEITKLSEKLLKNMK